MYGPKAAASKVSICYLFVGTILSNIVFNINILFIIIIVIIIIHSTLRVSSGLLGGSSSPLRGEQLTSEGGRMVPNSSRPSSASMSLVPAHTRLGYLGQELKQKF